VKCTRPSSEPDTLFFAGFAIPLRP
jgi:hypothetical protein